MLRRLTESGGIAEDMLAHSFAFELTMKRRPMLIHSETECKLEALSSISGLSCSYQSSRFLLLR